MVQIGAAPKSSLTNLADTVLGVRKLLGGELVTMHGEDVNLDQIQMELLPEVIPPLYIGAMRAKSLHLSGRVSDGTILTGMSSANYVRWARGQIQAGMLEGGPQQHRVVTYLDVKVGLDGSAARAAVRRSLAARLPWAGVQLEAEGIAAEVDSFIQTHGQSGLAEHMPDEWLDAFSAAGTPEQAAAGIQRVFEAGADSVVFQPLNGDPDCLDAYIRYLMPLLKPDRTKA